MSTINVDISDLIAGIPVINGNVDALVAEITKKVTLDILRNVVVATPVDTGRARGGWLVGLGAAPSGEGSTDKGGASTIAAGTAAVQATAPYTVAVIVNNVPYIGVPNDGHSKQAPKFFVESAVEAATTFPTK